MIELFCVVMAPSAASQRTLEETPTWAISIVCVILVLISFCIDHMIHLIGKWLKRKRKRSLYEALEKIKSELMLLGFMSLLLTVGQGPITNICISRELGSTWHPCKQDQKPGTSYDYTSSETNDRRKLLSFYDPDDVALRRILAAATDAGDKCAAKGKVSFVSVEGIHELHIFIFVLAISHILCCILTLALGQAKMKKWKAWEMETRTSEYQLHESLRFVGETSFGRRHLNLWTKKPLLMWIVCFFKLFVRFISVAKVDYLTLRHGFIMAHLAPQSQACFDFQKYIKRSVEDDFKVVVGIGPMIWFFAVVFMLSNTHGWYSHLWLPFIPLIIIFLVGTKLQSILTRMGLKIEERGEIVRGVPVVQPGDDLFWFNRPHLMLYLMNFVLFQNAFQLAFFTWSWYEYGLKSCFHDRSLEIIIRISMVFVVQILCSYVILPLYALVTQMGSTMKPSIFNERVTMALRNWHRSARKHIRDSRRGASLTPSSSRHTTPSHHHAAYLTHHYHQRSVDTSISPRMSSSDVELVDVDPLSVAYPEEGDDTTISSLSVHENDHYDHNGIVEEVEKRMHQEPSGLAEIVDIELIERTVSSSAITISQTQGEDGSSNHGEPDDEPIIATQHVIDIEEIESTMEQKGGRSEAED